MSRKNFKFKFNEKNNEVFLGAMIFVSMILVGCGNSIERDAKKLAKLQCEAQELMVTVLKGDNEETAKKFDKLNDEIETLSDKLEEKYTSEEDKFNFGLALLKEMGKCK